MVGDLAEDTAVRPAAEGRWTARLSDDWNIWGPNGGYVAAVCLRAAGAATDLARPATIACHYLSVAQFDDVDLEVTILRSTRRTAAIRVHMTQAGTSIADATVWAVADGLSGYEWDEAPLPDVPAPAALPTVEERLAGDPDAARSPFSFARNFEQRPLTWRTQQEMAAFTGGPHEARTWMRYVPTAAFDAPWVDACRSLVLLDTWAWPAAASGLPSTERGRYLAPNLDITARFHCHAAPSEWLFVDAQAPVASAGLIGTEVRVWTDDGRLAASGGAQLFCRPGPTSSG